MMRIMIKKNMGHNDAARLGRVEATFEGHYSQQAKYRVLTEEVWP
jgi:hypothetical protein